ncbi:hypothetical protein SCP_0214550 [Sparassis crispa]|uniref:Uncharacterized protein n=1 Tax=Sparassis crispa TaxID=139825 RepID=A0A401GDJ0_9APHY|nr:hypothetical protein SCP_0214550 [Sparassis crispa]GBE80244.1 hypothetical protein SCP_0214550 [Sparassis crispa]
MSQCMYFNSCIPLPADLRGGDTDTAVARPAQNAARLRDAVDWEDGRGGPTALSALAAGFCPDLRGSSRTWVVLPGLVWFFPDLRGSARTYTIRQALRIGMRPTACERFAVDRSSSKDHVDRPLQKLRSQRGLRNQMVQKFRWIGATVPPSRAA